MITDGRFVRPMYVRTAAGEEAAKPLRHDQRQQESTLYMKFQPITRIYSRTCSPDADVSSHVPSGDIISLRYAAVSVGSVM